MSDTNSAPPARASRKASSDEPLEVILARDYWPTGIVDVIRGDEVIKVDTNLAVPQAGMDARIRAGDVVMLPRSEAVKIINSGVAKMPEMKE